MPKNSSNEVSASWDRAFDGKTAPMESRSKTERSSRGEGEVPIMMAPGVRESRVDAN